MVKGEDAVTRKKNKVNRKRMRSSESSVSARVAAIIASKRRRKTGRRRGCEGMCFSLPTPDDPFNDRRDNAAPLTKKPKKKPLARKPNKARQDDKAANCKEDEQASGGPKIPLKIGRKGVGYHDDPEEGCLSKFLILCLNAIQTSWEEEEEVKEGAFDGSVDGTLLASSWGVEFWRCCSAGSNVVDTSGACASREQVAWVVSMASDAIARKEKQGLVIPSPFLIYLVPSQEKAVQVRSLCKPLKGLGVHTVSLHPGASLDHQVHGLKSCEPEFLVSTPDRLLELVSLKAVNISGTSLLVLDGMKDMVDFCFADKVKHIREHISGDPQTVVFSDCYGEILTPVVQNLLRGPVYRLYLHDSIASQSAFISQHLHFFTSEEEKTSKAIQILTEASNNLTPPQCLKVLFITLTACKAEMVASNLKSEGFAVSDDSLSDGSHGTDGEKGTTVLVKDIESMQQSDVEEIEIVIFMELSSSIEDYVGVLTKMARRSVAGMLHSFFCEADAPLAQPLMKVFKQCGQTVPEILSSILP